MLDYKTQSQLVDATASMLRSYLTASANTLAASTWRGLSLWAEMMGGDTTGRAPAAAKVPTLWPSMANLMMAPQPCVWPAWPWQATGPAARHGFAPFTGTWPGPSFSVWMQLPDWGVWRKSSLAIWNGWLAPRTAPPGDEAPPTARSAVSEPYASYRSAGGHAAAQVTAPGLMPPAEIAEVGATIVFDPMQTVLGAWRAALGGH
jgi:hypothetical protein